jgi:hypothetical protein
MPTYVQKTPANFISSSLVVQLRAPIAVAPESKRGPIIEKAEGDLEHEMETLEEGTKVRNREFQMHLVRGRVFVVWHSIADCNMLY